MIHFLGHTRTGIYRDIGLVDFCCQIAYDTMYANLAFAVGFKTNELLDLGYEVARATTLYDVLKLLDF